MSELSLRQQREAAEAADEARIAREAFLRQRAGECGLSGDSPDEWTAAARKIVKESDAVHEALRVAGNAVKDHNSETPRILAERKMELGRLECVLSTTRQKGERIKKAQAFLRQVASDEAKAAVQTAREFARDVKASCRQNEVDTAETEAYLATAKRHLQSLQANHGEHAEISATQERISTLETRLAKLAVDRQTLERAIVFSQQELESAEAELIAA